MSAKPRRITKGQRQEMQRALWQATVDERALARVGLVHLHDAMYDATLMGTMDKVIEGRPVDPENLRAAINLLHEHAAMTSRTIGGFECVQCGSPSHGAMTSPKPTCECGCRQVRLRRSRSSCRP